MKPMHLLHCNGEDGMRAAVYVCVWEREDTETITIGSSLKQI